MKKFLLGLLIGAGLTVFGLVFSGCNDRDRAYATHTVEQAPVAPVVTDIFAPPAPPADVIVNLPCECWPPGYCKGKWHHWKDKEHHHDD